MGEEVTEVDIRLFKTTLLARRFPGLQSLGDNDIQALIIADRKAAGRRLAAPQKTHPKSEIRPLPPKHEGWPASSKTPFVYINPAQAKLDVKRPDSQSFISLGSPYEADHMDYMDNKNDDEAKRSAPFRPSCFSQAKDTIKVDYFLNSNDTESKTAELRATRQRGKELIDSYMQQTRSRRGKTYI